MLNYAFIYLLAIKLIEWGGKSFSQSTDRTETSLPTSYVYDPTNTKTETNGEV